MGFFGSLLTTGAQMANAAVEGRQEGQDRAARMRKAMVEEALLGLRQQREDTERRLAERRLSNLLNPADQAALDVKTAGEKAGAEARARAEVDAGRPHEITMEGRRFPDTPDGRQEALQWKGQLSNQNGQQQGPDQLVPYGKTFAWVNPRTHAAAPALGPDGKPLPVTVRASGRPTQFQMQAKMLAPTLETAITHIQNYIGSYGRVPATSLLGRAGITGEYATPEDVQAYNTAAEQAATAILRLESGAAITKEEQESYRRQYVPQAGDKPQVIQRKLSALRQKLQQMKEIATSPGAEEEPGTAPDVEGRLDRLRQMGWSPQ